MCSYRWIDRLEYFRKQVLFVICYDSCVHSSDRVGIQTKYVDLADPHSGDLYGILEVTENLFKIIGRKILINWFWI